MPTILRHAFRSVLLVTPAMAQCIPSWPSTPFGSGADATVRASALLADGELVIGGRFANLDGTPLPRLGRWNGSSWSGLGSGADGDVNALRTLANGDLLAGGSFTTIGGVTCNQIARWNGSAWSPLATGLDPLVPLGASVQAITTLANGDLVIGGSFAGASGTPCANIARWNGSSWNPLGSGIAGPVRALATLPNGDLVATGTFVTAGGVTANHIARWNGSAWSALGSGTGNGLGLFGGAALAVAGNGDVFVGGTFLTAGGGTTNRIARWNGSAWSALGSGADGAVSSLAVLPSGELLAGGQFTQIGGIPAARIARWNGTTWSAFGAGADGSVFALQVDSSGAVVVGGDFATAGGNPASRLARLTSSCAPQASVVGTGCTGSAGPVALAALQLPLLGGRFRARGTGLPAFGITLAVTGLSSTSLPLSLALPQALPGCTLFANADLVDAVVPVGGTATTELGFPFNASLIGVPFFHQYVPLELDLVGNIVAVTASNALQVQLGSF